MDSFSILHRLDTGAGVTAVPTPETSLIPLLSPGNSSILSGWHVLPFYSIKCLLSTLSLPLYSGSFHLDFMIPWVGWL